MKRILCLGIFLAAVVAAPAFGAEEPLTAEKKATIKQLLETTGALNIGKQMSEVLVSQMSDALKAARPDIPSEAFDILKDEVNKTVGEAVVKTDGGFIEIVIPIYHKYLSLDDIKGLLKFYQTDLGQKTLKVLPQLMQEAQLAGARWGEQLGPLVGERVVQRLKEKGVDLSNPPPQKSGTPGKK